jgi:poly(3-hydroxybutyrate) depolymerase
MANFRRVFIIAYIGVLVLSLVTAQETPQISQPGAAGAAGAVPAAGSGDVYSENIEIKSGENTLRGVMTRPQNVKGKIPMVLMFHGMNVNIHEMNDLWAVLADTLAKEEIASVRFDFGGHGQSYSDIGQCSASSPN